MNKRAMMLSVFVAVFALSGFSGLIYESIWSHYLKLFLGHSSYAQVLVLAIFMGGMAMGSALAARLSGRLTNLILWYGIVEGIIGLFGLTFHSIFVAVQSAAFESIFPNLETSWLVHTVKWTIGSFMILPQSILLGATFPLLTAGLIRRFPGNSGKTLATLYFVNSFGAAIGVLTNAFVLIPAVGLPGSVLSAGLINIFLAIAIYFLAKGDHYPAPKPAVSATAASSVNSYLLAIAAFTGLASFMYEIGWIRMLTMVLGGSTHSFEIMLSAFILGLAIGGFWIRKKIDRFQNPLLALGLIQLIMGTFAALTIPLYNQTYELMGLVVATLNKNDSGYLLYTIFSYGISLIIMLPATICAGTTLPLATYIMLKGKSGDSAIGKVYAWNTVGSILGVVLAIQLVMPLLGLKWVIGAGALVDVVLGLYIMRRAQISLARHKPQLALATISLSIMLSIPFLGLDTQKMASGVYRYGLSLLSAGEVIFHKDGKTSTVAVKKNANNLVSLLNNGKPDAALKLSSSVDESKIDRFSDEPTMVLAGTLPYVYRPDASSIANIGLGSGLTAHVLLQNKELERLDTIEIEEAVYEAAKLFQPRVENLYADPRSHVTIEDAKTYFATSGRKYDVIVSEPSNPWVSGVSGLFSTEFYHEVKRYLKPNGVLVQWVQLYEITPELVANIYLALKENFADIHLYQIAAADVAIVAGMDSLEADYDTLFRHGELKNELGLVQVRQPSDLAFRKLAEKGALDIVFSSLAGTPNSDYFPILDIGAAKTRFKKSNASSVYTFRTAKALKSLVDETPLSFSEVTESPSISATLLLKEKRAFHRLFTKYSESGIVPLITTSQAEDHAKKLAEIIAYCQSNQAGKSADVISKQIIDLGQWAYDYSESDDMRQLFDKMGGCRHRLNENGGLWLEAHLAWLDGDLPQVLELTKKYLDSQQSISTSADMRLLKFNIVSHIKKGTGTDVYKYYDKVASAIAKDLELRGLFYRFDPSLIVKK